MTAALPRPAPAAERVRRALAMVDAAAVTPHRYVLGAGDYQPDEDLPCTRQAAAQGTVLASDCIGAAMHACRLPRRRAGYNVGNWAVVSGYVNTDSAIQDAQHHRDLFKIAERPMPGDLLCWPSIYEGELERERRRRGKRVRIGHIAVIVEVLAAEWSAAAPAWSLIQLVQCGSAHRPAIHRSSGAAWADRDRTRWGQRPEWSSVILRPLA